MTHRGHLNQDELILSVVDENDLTGETRRHLEACPECQGQRIGLEADLSQMGRLAKAHCPQPSGKIEFDPEPRTLLVGRFPALAAACVIVMAIVGTWWFASLDPMNEQATARLMSEMEEDSRLLDEIAEIVTLAEENWSPPIFTETNGNYSQEFMEFVIPFEDDRTEAGKTLFSRGIFT